MNLMYKNIIRPIIKMKLSLTVKIWLMALGITLIYLMKITIIFTVPPASMSKILPSSITFSEDKYFRPLLKAFKLGFNNSNTNKINFQKSSTPTFLLVAKDALSHSFWSQQLLHISLGQCPLPCNFTDDKSKADEVDAVVFFLRDIKNKTHMINGFPSPRNLSTPWIMFSLEAALRANSLYGTPYTEWNGVFNRTMMHRTDADIFTPHGFIVKNEDLPYIPKDWVLPTADVPAHIVRKLAVAFITNCNAQSGRLEYIKEMQNYGQVDVYGGCGNLTCGGSHYVEHAYKINTDKCFKKAGTNYLFYLAFENCICKDYGTEKLYNLLYYPIVPIVLGGVDYQSILPPNSYINAADYSPEELVKYLLKLQNNPEKYNEYLAWRSFYRPSTIGGIVSMCHLCVRLYDSSFYEYNVYEDFYKWLYTDSHCNRGWVNSTVGVSLIKI